MICYGSWFCAPVCSEVLSKNLLWFWGSYGGFVPCYCSNLSSLFVSSGFLSLVMWVLFLVIGYLYLIPRFLCSQCQACVMFSCLLYFVFSFAFLLFLCDLVQLYVSSGVLTSPNHPLVYLLSQPPFVLCQSINSSSLCASQFASAPREPQFSCCTWSFLFLFVFVLQFSAKKKACLKFTPVCHMCVYIWVLTPRTLSHETLIFSNAMFKIYHHLQIKHSHISPSLCVNLSFQQFCTHRRMIQHVSLIFKLSKWMQILQLSAFTWHFLQEMDFVVFISVNSAFRELRSKSL